MKKIIVNADDLGLCDSVNRGIERAHRDGILTSATLMANVSGFEGGVRVVKENPRLGVGVHLNVIRGKALSREMLDSEYTFSNGDFNRSFFHIIRFADDIKFLRACEAEYRAQIERILGEDIVPTHLDFEKHHGVNRSIYDLAQKLAVEYGIGAIRSYHEPVWRVMCNLPLAGIKACGRSGFLRLLGNRCVIHEGVKSPDHFFGQMHIGRMATKVWSALLDNLPEGVSEVMVHPGEIMTPEEMQKVEWETGSSWINQSRAVELEALCDPVVRMHASANGVEFVNFAGI